MQKFNDAAASRLSVSSLLRRFRLSRATTEKAGRSRAIMQARLEPTNRRQRLRQFASLTNYEISRSVGHTQYLGQFLNGMLYIAKYAKFCVWRE